MVSASTALLALTLLFALVSQVLIASRLKILTDLQGLELSAIEIFQINLATIFYSLFLPAGNFTGIAIRFYKLSNPQKKYSGSIISLVFDRVAATIALCIVGILFWLLDLPLESWPALVIMLISLFVLFVFQRISSMDWVYLKKGIMSRWLGKKFMKPIDSISQATALLRVMPRHSKWRIYCLSILAQLAGIAAYYFIALSLELDVSMLTIAWTRSAAVLVAMLPISIAGLGLRETTFLILLMPYGILESDVLAYSLLVFATTILAIGLLGGLFEGRWIIHSRSINLRFQISVCVGSNLHYTFYKYH
jgi:uncharacterized protein (TIRG00374 family)